MYSITSCVSEKLISNNYPLLSYLFKMAANILIKIIQLLSSYELDYFKGRLICKFQNAFESILHQLSHPSLSK